MLERIEHNATWMPLTGPFLLGVASVTEVAGDRSMHWLTTACAAAGFGLTAFAAVTTVFCNIPRLVDTAFYLRDGGWRRRSTPTPPAAVYDSTGVAVAQQGVSPAPVQKYPVPPERTPGESPSAVLRWKNGIALASSKNPPLPPGTKNPPLGPPEV
jgi:hypothetical protein